MSSNAHAPGRIGRALIVDDEFLICTAIADILTRRGIEARTQASDLRLEEVVQAFEPQVLFLDIRLGSSDAFHAMKHRLTEDFQGVVCLISGSPLDYLLEASAVGSELGLTMGSVLKKPFEEDDVVDALDAAELILASRSIGDTQRRGDRTGSLPPRLTLRGALEHDRLEVWYQPKFDLVTEAVAGAEALVRGRSEEGAVISPGELFHGASQQDFLALTAVVLRRAIDDCRKLAELGMGQKLSVNVPTSFLALNEPANFVREVSQELWWPGMIFEVTEDEALANLEVVAAVALQLRLYAVELSIDDFGAGYSSLARLRDLPFSEIKLDRGFVDGCASDSTKLAICKSAVSLGMELDCTTVAEGVEAEEDLVALRDLGCQLVHGFRLARPMTFDALKALLSDAR